MNNITIIQHNVLHWESRKHNLINSYLNINPNKCPGNEKPRANKIPGYTTYQMNSSNEMHDGSAILIKSHIKHRLDDNYITDFIDIAFETENGLLNIATTYLPPRRPYLPFPDFHRFIFKNNPAYIIADLNASSTMLGTNHTNQVGKHLNRFINNGTINHLGPDFPTYMSRNTRTTPDLVLCNNKATYNVLLKPGPLTLSDHIPIIMSLTTKAIMKQIPRRLNFKNTNWEILKEEIETKINNININNNLSIQEIDEKLELWYNSIETTIANNIPSITQVTEYKPISNPHLRYIQHMYNQLQLRANTSGWTIENYNYYKILRIALKQETEVIRNNNWEELLTRIALKYKNPKTFWPEIKTKRK